MGADSFNKLLLSTRRYFANNTTMSISDFKILSKLTRKNAIPILEYFDNNNFTIRDGSNRTAGKDLYVE